MKSKVIFNCNILDPLGIAFSYPFRTNSELKVIIKDENWTHVNIIRDVIVFQRDKKKCGIIYSPNGIKIPVEKLAFTVADKLMYPKDVREYLIKTYGSVLDFENYVQDENTPIKFKVYENSEYRFFNTVDSVAVPKYYVKAEHIGPKEIVIDKNLHEIYPNRTNKVQPALAQMLARKKEIIR